jgi:proteasome lid subunit RPN8/RPN11
MYRYVAFLDSVLEQIEEHIARFPPERGGALLGPVGQPLVTEFIFDPEARTSGMTFTPSRALADRVRARESADQQIELKGILHSHPGDMSRPSQGDHYAYEDSLEGAPWLGRLVAPIVTVGTRLRREHDVPLPSGTMSVYIAERRPDARAGVAVEPAEPHVLRISRDLKSLASALGGTAEPPFITDIEGQTYVAGVVGCEGFDLQVLVGPAYPFTPPVVIAARRPEAKGDLAEPRLGLHWKGDSPASQGLRLAWDLETPDETRLLAALLAAGQAPGAPPAALAALAAGQAALTAAQAALAAGQAALAAGQAALAAEQPEPEAELEAQPAAELAEPEAEPEAEPTAEDAEETKPGGELAALAVDEAEPEADETEPDAATDSESTEPDAELAESEAEEVEAYANLVVIAAEQAKPEAEEAEPGAEPAEPRAEDAEPRAEEVVPVVDGAEQEADHAPDIGPDTPDGGAMSSPSPGWFGRLLQWIKRVLSPGSRRGRAAAQPAAATDSETEAVPETIPDDDLAAVRGTGRADD